jgi:hypothetical protein
MLKPRADESFQNTGDDCSGETEGRIVFKIIGEYGDETERWFAFPKH